MNWFYAEGSQQKGPVSEYDLAGLVRQGIGIIMTSSELPELLTVCDRILVLSEGRLTGQFARREATEQKIMEAATRGRNL